MPRRRKKPELASTAIDAIIVALSPALIIGMVSCLVFFLVVAFYRGQYDQRLLYILFLYTLATVLIARIAIESGRSYAMAFSVPLAIATMIAMLRFVTVSGPLASIGWLINVVLLGIAWFLSDRITFDCTLLDDREAGVQQGLLQSLGLLQKDDINANTPADSSTSHRQAKDSSSTSRPSKRGKKKHNPGVWVLYFALLAFPLFGFGQLVIPTEEGRDRAFFYLVGYLACALALLITTSFVSMRRYLRHRGVAMPEEMSRVWLGYGAFGIFAVLVLCMLLPLPGRSLGLVGLPFEFDSPPGLDASNRGWGDEGIENADNQDAAKTTRRDAEADGSEASPDGDGKPQASDSASSDNSRVASESGESGDGKGQGSKDNASDSSDSSKNSDTTNGESQSQKSDSQSSQSGSEPQTKGQEPSSSGDDANANRGEPDRNESSEGNENKQSETENQKNAEEGDSDSKESSPAGNRQAEQQEENESRESSDESAPQNRNANSPQSPSWFSALPSSIANLFKWITILLLAGVVIVYVITHPREIANMWRELLRLLGNLFGGKNAAAIESENTAIQSSVESKTIQPFGSFANPFNPPANWTPERIIEHTFAALEAWAAEHGVVRRNEQTAAEFARTLAAKAPSLRNHALNAAKMLDELMFADWRPKPNDIEPLEALWRAMQSK